MGFYRWLVDRYYTKSIMEIVEEEAAGASTDADPTRYMNGISHPCFHLEAGKNILGGKMNGVIKKLPSDVWFEILRRFPAADLFPLKAVCKTFHQLISDDLFARLNLNDITKLHPNATRAIISFKSIQSHLNYYDPDKMTLGVCYEEGKFHDWCIHVYSTTFGSPLIRISRDRVLDSYHGLLLVKICDRLLLCNPITRSYQFLPSVCLSAFWKIAYDNVSKQYKVFGLSRVLYVLDVHRDGALNSPRETTVDTKVGSEIIRYQLIKESVYVNGNVHWLLVNSGQACIVSANVTTEEVKTRTCSSFKKPFFRSVYDDYFFAANGKFYLGQSFFRYERHELKLWVLEGVDSENPNPSWMIKNRVASTLNSWYSWCSFDILGMFRDKVLIMITGHVCLLYQYDMTSAELKMVTVASGADNIEYKWSDLESSRIIEHIDSLVCL